MTEDNVIFIGDQEVHTKDLTEEQKYFWQQVLDLKNKQARIQFELDQVNASLSVFDNALTESYKKSSQEKSEEKVN
jgi:hypothetical protein